MFCPIDKKCAYTQADYFDSLCEMAFWAYQNSICSNCVCNIAISDAKKLSGLPLTSPDLHDGKVLTLQPIKLAAGNELYAAYRFFVHPIIILGDRNHQRRELLLWYAVSVSDAALLKKVLAEYRYVIPPKCLFAVLVHRAITCCFDEGLRILLQNGASPEICLGNGICQASIFQVCLNGSDDIRAKHLVQDESVSQCIENMVKCLVEAGANLSAINEETDEIALHFAAHCSLRSAGAARRLIEATPRAGLSKPSNRLTSRYDLFETDKTTPLENALICAALVATSNDKVVRIISSAVLPLLRAGASINRSIFSFEIPPETCLLLGFWSNLGNSTRSLLFLNLFCDISGSRPFDLNKWARHLENFQHFRFHALDFNLLKRQLKAQFPRSLYALCRSAVLVQLPTGAQARRTSIERLCLPKNVADWLNYREYDDTLSGFND